MKSRLQSFLLMLASATDKELAQQIQYLKEENRILRARLVKKLAIRRVQIAGMTTTPDAAWMVEQGEQLVRFFVDQSDKPRYLIRDLDGMFTREFDSRLKNAELEIVRVGPRAPNLNAFCERWVLSVKAECLSHFLVFGQRHLRYLLDEYLA